MTKPAVMRRFRVGFDEVPASPPTYVTIDAAHYRHDDGFTTFTDTDGQVVYAIKTYLINVIERLPDPEADSN